MLRHARTGEQASRQVGERSEVASHPSRRRDDDNDTTLSFQVLHACLRARACMEFGGVVGFVANLNRSGTGTAFPA